MFGVPNRDYKFLPAAPDMDREVIFAGGRLCLDFINTLCRRGDAALEFIGDIEALNIWLKGAQDVYGFALAPEGQGGQDESCRDVLPRAIALRSALRGVVMSAVAGSPAREADLEAINAVLRSRPAVIRIVQEGGVLRIKESLSGSGDAWLARIARDAADLLAHGNLAHIRQCDHPTCVRVFYDMTRNHRKRWCSEKCGSHTKAAAYYRRKMSSRSSKSKG